MLFNDLLESVGIAAKDVRLLRHQTPASGVLHQSIYNLWRDDRSGFEKYQSTQRLDKPIFRTGSIWAAFVCPDPKTTLFVGLYDAKYHGAADVDWICPYRGERSFSEHPYGVFTTTLRPELAQYIGKMPIEWSLESVRTWARYAQSAAFEVVGEFGPSDQNDQLYGVELIDALGSLGFEVQHETKKVTQLRRDNLIAYVKRQVRVRPLVVHPHFLEFAESLRASIGVSVELPPRPYINSNLVAFPAFDASHRESAGRRGFAIGVTARQLPALISALQIHSVVETQDGPVRVVASPDQPLT